jgi:hypothetical protein
MLARRHLAFALAVERFYPVQIHVNWNIYSSAVAKSVARAIAESSDFTYNPDMPHPDLYLPDLDPANVDWGLEISATQHGHALFLPHQARTRWADSAG